MDHFLHFCANQCLLVVQEFDLNRILMKGKNGKMKEYDMTFNDKLWMEYKGSAFPLVAEAIQGEVEAYKNSGDEIKRLKSVMVCC